MRFDGAIKTWNDERGFGFIEPTLGGQEIFAYIKAFPAQAGRPQAGQRVTFEVELNAEGKKRAKAVRPLRPAKPIRRTARAGAAQWGTASYFAIPAFAIFYLAVAAAWRVPAWVAGLYLAASVVALFVYAFDKSAAEAGRWRTSESTLLAVGLVGGWPGAIVAQQLLRHKSSKASFRAAFWSTVVVNVVAFALLASPMRRQVLGM